MSQTPIEVADLLERLTSTKVTFNMGRRRTLPTNPDGAKAAACIRELVEINERQKREIDGWWDAALGHPDA